MDLNVVLESVLSLDERNRKRFGKRNWEQIVPNAYGVGIFNSKRRRVNLALFSLHNRRLSVG